MDINKMTVVELESMAYRSIVTVENETRSRQILEQQIMIKKIQEKALKEVKQEYKEV